MKCTIFRGHYLEAQEDFNRWAKGKNLTRDVIIHEQVLFSHEEPSIAHLLIIVYHPEGKEWDTTAPDPFPPILTKTIESPRMESEVIA